jgi:CubicO group peptidase (beta-lactamase class C family)
MMKKVLGCAVIVVFMITSCGSPDSTAQPSSTAISTELTLPTQTPSAADTPIPATPTKTPATASPTHTVPPATETEAAPEPVSAPFDADEIDDSIAGLAANDRLSGAVLIAWQGKPFLERAYGMADRDQNIRNQTDTKFNLGSMDKMFTAISILQLAEQGRLSLDDSAAVYLPDYANQEVARSVTIHQLLTHTSGMGNYFDSPLYAEIHDQIRSAADYLQLFIDTPLQFEPGERFAYSNSGYIVLGLIIEAVTGQNYYEYVRENIFEPSGMSDTAAYEVDAGTPNLAIGYTYLDENGMQTDQLSDNLFVLPMRGGPAGGGYSTAPDLNAFANALLSYKLLSPEMTDLLLEGKVELNEGVKYAYGFFDRTVRGQRAVGHGGGFPGICSILAIYPDLELTTVVLTNSDGDCVTVDEIIKEKLIG